MKTDIEAIRESLGMKPVEFARAISVTPSQGADFRSGRRKPPLSVLARLEALTGRPLVAEAVAKMIAG